MSTKIIDSEQNRQGIWYGFSAFTIWGVLPLYWKLLQVVPSLEILFHRILWSFVFLALALLMSRDWHSVHLVLQRPKKLLLIFTAGVLVSLNWYTYIYAVNSDQVIEASMGYFINPLVVVLMGVTVFKEKLSRWQLVAICLAFIGVLVVTVQFGRVPWIALLLAFSFALYGMVKKIVSVDAMTGLTLETFIVMPIALFLIVRLETAGSGSFLSVSPFISITLAGTGIITAIPLLLYAKGIGKTTFSMMGFLQYIAPSIQLLLGIFVFKEPFSAVQFISFCFIWAGLAVFTLANLGLLKERTRIQAAK